jgi:hypothetical protein
VDELRAVLTSDDNASICVLRSGVHNHKRLLTEGLREALRSSTESPPHVVVMVGAECDSDVNVGEMARDAGASIPAEKNCIEMLIGQDRRRELEQGRASIITPGWIRMVHEAIAAGLWTEVDARTTFGFFDRLVLLDFGTSEITDELVLEFFDLVKVPVDVVPADLGYFRERVRSLLAGAPDTDGVTP